ncbi:hypothetical protein WN55_01171 [Dufourea novaeangliae]|uniref:Uncharacterized protein n=1 Tax=Dufourea novaeangliae TaxID=178035 RepID=A0A154PFU4_DUFNO|nr:hypothetical protein WN55_01171 [Dufourea novaeangliae]
MPVVENGDERVKAGGSIHDHHYPSSLLGLHIKGGFLQGSTIDVPLVRITRTTTEIVFSWVDIL